METQNTRPENGLIEDDFMKRKTKIEKSIDRIGNLIGFLLFFALLAGIALFCIISEDNILTGIASVIMFVASIMVSFITAGYFKGD